MNLKEAFRYQNFLDKMMSEACASVTRSDHCLKTTYRHLRSKACEGAVDEDIPQEVSEFFCNDEVIGFMGFLIEQREALSDAIGLAKASIGFDLDSALEANKFRQRYCSALKTMLNIKARKTTSKGSDYKFDVNGVQSPYYYPLEVICEEAYNRDVSKTLMRECLLEADGISAAIDAALINTSVAFDPVIDVNDSFDDAMTFFIAEYSA